MRELFDILFSTFTNITNEFKNAYKKNVYKVLKSLEVETIELTTYLIKCHTEYLHHNDEFMVDKALNMNKEDMDKKQSDEFYDKCN